MLFFFLQYPSVFPQSTGQSGELLRYGIGAKEIALGSSFMAADGSASSVYWNPAGLDGCSKFTAAVSHTNLFLDSSFDFLGVSYSYTKATFGVGIVQLQSAGFEQRTSRNEKGDKFSLYQRALLASVSYRFSSHIRVGLTVKHMCSGIGLENTSEYQETLYDLGTIIDISDKISLGCAVQNISDRSFSEISYINSSFTVPPNFRIGGTGSGLLNSIKNWDFFFDLNTFFPVSTKDPYNASLGAEYTWNVKSETKICFRFSYGNRYLCAGLGLTTPLPRLTIDATWQLPLHKKNDHLGIPLWIGMTFSSMK